jgi:hypothetical protein
MSFASSNEIEQLSLLVVEEQAAKPIPELAVQERKVEKQNILPIELATPEGQVSSGTIRTKKWVKVCIGFLMIGTVAMMVIVWASRRKSDWLVIDKDANGEIAELAIKKDMIPHDVLAKIGKTKDVSKLNRDAIRHLANEHKLFGPWPMNSHLQFTEGDIAWWNEQSYLGWEIELEFLSRKCVLAAADRQQVSIKDQGKLSFWSEKVKRTLSHRWDKVLASEP